MELVPSNGHMVACVLTVALYVLQVFGFYAGAGFPVYRH
jgi:hypothetical protein